MARYIPENAVIGEESTFGGVHIEEDEKSISVKDLNKELNIDLSLTNNCLRLQEVGDIHKGNVVKVSVESSFNNIPYRVNRIVRSCEDWGQVVVNPFDNRANPMKINIDKMTAFKNNHLMVNGGKVLNESPSEGEEPSENYYTSISDLCIVSDKILIKFYDDLDMSDMISMMI